MGFAASRLVVQYELMDNLVVLDRALAQMGRIIAAIPHDEASSPTPCSEWNVREVVRHVVGKDLANFATSARGEIPDWQTPPVELEADWAAQYESGAAAVRAAWKEGDPDRLVPAHSGQEVPVRARANQQIAELAVHGWDLVKATGQRIELDPEVGEVSLNWARLMLQPEHRGPDKAFDVEVPVPEDAPIYDRLAGWFGRDPQWTPDRA